MSQPHCVLLDIGDLTVTWAQFLGYFDVTVQYSKVQQVTLKVCRRVRSKSQASYSKLGREGGNRIHTIFPVMSKSSSIFLWTWSFTATFPSGLEVSLQHFPVGVRVWSNFPWTTKKHTLITFLKEKCTSCGDLQTQWHPKFSYGELIGPIEKCWEHYTQFFSKMHAWRPEVYITPW